jgi:hypothetical protein
VPRTCHLRGYQVLQRLQTPPQLNRDALPSPSAPPPPSPPLLAHDILPSHRNAYLQPCTCHFRGYQVLQ